MTKIVFTPEMDARIIADDLADIPGWVTGRALGISRSSVCQRALNLRGYSKRPRPGGLPAIEWTEAMDAVVLQAAQGGISRAEAAASIGVSEASFNRRLKLLKGLPKPACTSSVTALKLADAALQELRERVIPKTSAQRPAQRTCLVCRKSFHSAHAGNRICPNCRQGQSEQRGLDEARFFRY